MKNILVTGADGQLGMELRDLADFYPDFNFIFSNKEQLDITNADVVENFFSIYQIDFCINCAAYTKVDKAEEEHELAFKINADAPENLAKICKRHNVIFIHISTDFVFDGKKSIPYIEKDPTKALSVYGQSKLSGEEKIAASTSKYLIIRTSWVYSHYGHNFMKTMSRLGGEKSDLRVVYDQIGTPTYAKDLAHAILKMVSHNDLPNKFGVYHFSNEGVASWYDFAHAIMELQNYNCKVFPIETNEYPTPAARPSYSVLNKSKIKSAFDLQIPHWRESLTACLKK